MYEADEIINTIVNSASNLEKKNKWITSTENS